MSISFKNLSYNIEIVLYFFKQMLEKGIISILLSCKIFLLPLLETDIYHDK